MLFLHFVGHFPTFSTTRDKMSEELIIRPATAAEQAQWTPLSIIQETSVFREFQLLLGLSTDRQLGVMVQKPMNAKGKGFVVFYDLNANISLPFQSWKPSSSEEVAQLLETWQSCVRPECYTMVATSRHNGTRARRWVEAAVDHEFLVFATAGMPPLSILPRGTAVEKLVNDYLGPFFEDPTALPLASLATGQQPWYCGTVDPLEELPTGTSMLVCDEPEQSFACREHLYELRLQAKKDEQVFVVPSDEFFVQCVASSGSSHLRQLLQFLVDRVPFAFAGIVLKPTEEEPFRCAAFRNPQHCLTIVRHIDNPLEFISKDKKARGIEEIEDDDESEDEAPLLSGKRSRFL